MVRSNIINVRNVIGPQLTAVISVMCQIIKGFPNLNSPVEKVLPLKVLHGPKAYHVLSQKPQIQPKHPIVPLRREETTGKAEDSDTPQMGLAPAACSSWYWHSPTCGTVVRGQHRGKALNLLAIKVCVWVGGFFDISEKEK